MEGGVMRAYSKVGKIMFGFVLAVTLSSLLHILPAQSEDTAFRFDGTNHLRIPLSDSLPNGFFSSDKWTLEMRIKRPEGSAPGEVFMGVWHKPRLVLYGAELVLAGFVNSNYTVFARVPNAVAGEVWTHIVCVADSANYRVFVNGTEKVSSTYQQIDSGATEFLLGVGGEGRGSFEGLMDDVRIYNRALSANEVSNNYINKDTPVTAGMVSWWKLDRSSEDFLKQNNAQIVGNELWANLDEPAVTEPPEEGTATLPGEFVMELPTIHCLGFRWFITGDDNGNAKVEVSFRKKGEVIWQPALPMMRVNREAVYRDVRKFYCGNLFAESLLNLEEDTEYEARFRLTDPDGGEAEKIVTARTRATPKRYEGERTVHVYPQTLVA